MTATEFVCRVREIAKAYPESVLAVDFEPSPDKTQLNFTFRFKRSGEPAPTPE